MTRRPGRAAPSTRPTGGALIVQIIPGQELIGHWLDGAAKPLARVLDKPTPDEQEAFLKAMDLLETELHRQEHAANRALPAGPRPASH